MKKLKIDEEKVEKCYLISKKWLNDYKKFYFNDKLLEMLEKNFEINDLIDLTHDMKKIIFNNMFSYNNNKYDFNHKIKENGNKTFKFSEETINNEIFPKINSQLNYNNIEIINEDILNKLIVNDINKEIKRNKKNKYKDYEYIIKEKQIIIKVEEKEPKEIFYLVRFNCDCNKKIKISFNFYEKKEYKTKIELDHEFNKAKKINIDNQSNKEENLKNEESKETLVKNKEKEKNNESKESSKENIIKMLIMYYIFKNKFKENIEKYEKNFNEEYFYLINKKWLEEIKKSYFYDGIKNILSSNNNIKKIIKEKNNIYSEENINDIYKIIKNEVHKNLFSKINKEKENNIENLDNLKPKLKTEIIKGKTIKYFDKFDLINESIFKKIINNGKINLSEKKFRIKCLISKDNIIIMFKKKKSGINFDYLLIEDYNKEEFKAKTIILFSKEDIIKTHFKNIKSLGFSEYKKEYIKPDYKIFNKTEEIGECFEINSESNKQNENILNKNIKIIEFFIRLYIYYEDLEKIINNSSKNFEEKFYLINKNWLDKYKYNYLYEEIKNILLYDEKVKNNFQNNKDNIEELLYWFPKEFKQKFEKLNNIKEKENPYDVIHELDKKYINKNIKYQKIDYFKDFEIFSDKIINLFLKALKENNINEEDKYIKRSCIIKGQKIIIPFSEKGGYIYNICKFENHILTTEKIIILKDNSNSNIYRNYIMECSDYIFSYNNNLNDKSFSIIQLNKTTQNETPIKNKEDSDFENLIHTYINLEVLKKKIKSDLKANYKDKEEKKPKKDEKKKAKSQKNLTKEFSLINYNALIETIDINQLKNIFEKNNELKKIIDKDNLNSNEKLREIIPIIDEKLKNEIKKCKKKNFDFDKINEIDFDYIEKGRNKIEYFKNFLILNKKVIKIINNEYNECNNYHCILGDQKLFLILKNNNQNIIEIYNINNNKNLNIDLIFDIQEGYPQEILENIIEIGYKTYLERNTFINNKNYVSPIIFKADKIIGYSYKYKENLDYSLYHINQNLKGMISLYYFNKYLKYSIKNKIKKKGKYYLLNAEYLDEYKRIYYYESVKNILDNLEYVQSFSNNFLKNTDTLTEMNILTFINSFPDNEININLNKLGPQIIEKEDVPNLKPIKYKYNNKIYSLFFYDKLKLINTKIYYAIFSEENQQKNNYNTCIFVDGFIIIKLSEHLNDLNNFKFVYELGQLDENNVFHPKYVLIYYNKEDFYDHLEKLINQINSYLNKLNFENDNHLPIYLNNREIGIIVNLSIKIKDDDEKIIKPSPSPSPEPINFLYPPLIGLQNVGATCYMNATLQCFCQIKKLVYFFKNNSQIREIEMKYKNNSTNCLSLSFKNLVENLWPTNPQYISKKYNFKNSNNAYFAPYEFKNTISVMNPLFRGAQANDSKDLVNFIIMTLHEELNRAKKEKNVNLNNLTIDQTNIEQVLNYFSINFANENKSIISDLFYAMNGTSTKCLKCNLIKYNFQIYFFLIFPLEEVRKMKINNLKNQFNLMYQNNMMMNLMVQNFNYNIQNINSVNIYDCFDYNQKLEFFTGENSMYCNNCKSQQPASYNTLLFTAPEIIIIVLNRGKGIEFNVKLDFYEELNLQNYVQFNNFGYLYNLIGVVTHLGESGASGHFIAYSKSPVDNQWYRYNDDIVTKVKNFKEEIIDYAMPYILFFNKIK